MTKGVVFVTRPGKPGATLTDALSLHGIQAVHVPTLQIVPLSSEAPDKTFDACIFISPTSVDNSFIHDPDWLGGETKVIAVGSGTAAALQQRGMLEVLIPATFNSEGLLAMAELSDVAGKQILLVKGEGGRPLLEEVLAQRGAQVTA